MAGGLNEFSSANIVSCNSSNELTQHLYLLCASKDKIKWFGEFESLKEFLSKNLNLQGKWSSPGGKCKLLQTKEISIRWYSDRKSLNINGVGENVKRIKTELLSMAKTANDIELNSEVESQDESDEMNTHVPTLPEANIQVQNLPETCDEEDNIVCNDCRKLSIDVAEVKFELALVWAKINALDQKPCQCESLKRENNLLRKQVECLQSKLTDSQSSSRLEKSQDRLNIDEKTEVRNVLRIKFQHLQSCHFRVN